MAVVRTLVSEQESSEQTRPNLWRRQLPFRKRSPSGQWRGLGKCEEVRVQDQPEAGSSEYPKQVRRYLKCRQLFSLFSICPSPFMPLCHCACCAFRIKCFSLHPLLCLANSPSTFTFPRDGLQCHILGCVGCSPLCPSTVCAVVTWGHHVPVSGLPSTGDNRILESRRLRSSLLGPQSTGQGLTPGQCVGM